MRGLVADVKDTSIYRRLLEVNTLGAVYTAHYCLPLLRAAGPAARMIVISSVSGLFGLCGLAGLAHCPGKARFLSSILLTAIRMIKMRIVRSLTLGVMTCPVTCCCGEPRLHIQWSLVTEIYVYDHGRPMLILLGYCMSKAALHGFFEALRNEGSVGVTMVCPGFMDTDMPKKNLTVDGKPVGQQDGMHRGKAWPPAYIASEIVRAASAGQRDVSLNCHQGFRWQRESC